MVLAPGKGKSCVIVESELDAILAAQEARDVVSCVALGTARGKPDAAAHVLFLAAPVVLVALDFDEAGAGGWPWWHGHYTNAKRWPVPSGKDVGDLMTDRDGCRVRQNRDGLTDKPPGDAVTVGVHLDAGFHVDHAAQFPCRGVRRTPAKRCKRHPFIAVETQARGFLRGAMLGKELLAHDVAIAAMLEKRRTQPHLKAIEEARPSRCLVRGVAASFQVAFDRVAGQAKLTRDLPAAKTESVQLHDGLRRKSRSLS